MNTAVDTNILFDILLPDQTHRNESRRALSLAARSGPLLLSEPVYAELAARSLHRGETDAFLNRLGISQEASSREMLHAAGQAWGRYLAARKPDFGCPECGASVEVRCPRCASLVTRRQHVLADFMIGAHALVHAGRLLTRDRGYYGTYFPELVLV